MRFVLVLLVIVITIQSTIAMDCVCECCIGNGCTPTYVAKQYFVFCSESTNCKQDECSAVHAACPFKGSPGQTRAVCRDTSSAVGATSAHLLPTILMIIGTNILLRLFKDKF